MTPLSLKAYGVTPAAIQAAAETVQRLAPIPATGDDILALETEARELHAALHGLAGVPSGPLDSLENQERQRRLSGIKERIVQLRREKAEAAAIQGQREAAAERLQAAHDSQMAGYVAHGGTAARFGELWDSRLRDEFLLGAPERQAQAVVAATERKRAGYGL